MTDVISTRMTHEYDGDLVVFLIGMRINKPWRPDLWLPVFFAMSKVLAELSKDADSGLLGYRLTFGAGGPLLVQYWNSHDKLYAYASDLNAAQPSRLDRVQPPCPEGSGRGRHLARDLCSGSGRIHLLRYARFRSGRGYIVCPGCAARRAGGRAARHASGRLRRRPSTAQCELQLGEKWSDHRFRQR